MQYIWYASCVAKEWKGQVMNGMVNWQKLKGVAIASALVLSCAAYADGPQAMFAVSYTWGGSIGNGNLGVSLKVISSREENNVIAAAGVTYYPWAPVEKFGADVGAGYLFDSFALTGGWDFIQSDWIVSAGYVNTIDDDDDDDSTGGDTGGGGGGA